MDNRRSSFDTISVEGNDDVLHGPGEGFIISQWNFVSVVGLFIAPLLK